MLRYTILRFLVFFACLAALWLLGLRDQMERPWLVVGAALLSMVVSAVVLRPFREDAVRAIEERRARKTGMADGGDAPVEERRPLRARRRREADGESDEALEDSEAYGDEQYR